MSLDSRTTFELLEREAELQAVDAAIERAGQQAGGLLVIDGPPGLGKTALMEAARDRAAEAGLSVLTARGAELEREFAFGVIRQLYDLALRDTPAAPETLFAGAARFAAPQLDVLIDGAPQNPSEDPFVARHAVYWLTANLAAERPMALLVDDAQWADDASLGTLAHLANRLEGLPMALVVATRTGDAPVPLEAMRRQADAAGALLRVAPLSEAAAAAVVRSFAPNADDELCAACYRASGGNPFLLHELTRTVLSGGEIAVSPEEVLDESPERVTREVGGRLNRLPDTAARLARGAAVLGQDVPLQRAAALAGITHQEAAEAADALRSADVLDSSEPVRFRHPLVRAAVYDGLGPAARARDHGRAARLLADDDAAPELVAAQLLQCPPASDPWACDQLVAAARQAAARGGVEAAARYLRRALDEPPPTPIRPQVLLELGVSEALSSAPEPAIEHLREALRADLPPELRLRAAIVCASLLGHLYRITEAADVIEEQLDHFADHPDLRANGEAAFLNVTRVSPETRPRAHAVIERLRARVQGHDERDPAVLGAVATEILMAAEPADQAAELAERALEDFDWHGAGPDWRGHIASRVLALCDRDDVALPALEQAIEVARDRGSVIDLGGGLAFRAELLLRRGDLAGAEVDARTLLEIATSTGWYGGVGFAAAWLGAVLVERGELDEAERLLEGDDAEALSRGYTGAEVLIARGRLRVARGDRDAGIDALRDAGRWSNGVAVLNPTGAPWRSELAHALVDAGQSDEARRVAQDELELAESFGAPRPRLVAMRAVARAEGGDQEIAMLREAIALAEDTVAPLECARAHIALGSALRRAKAPVEETRAALRSAVELAHRCGASVLEDQALDELRATGARPRRRVTTGVDALTPSERRIAQLAADGQQNREIAQTLFVTTHTVEFHLRNAYRKLGITGRTELAPAFRPH